MLDKVLYSNHSLQNYPWERRIISAPRSRSSFVSTQACMDCYWGKQFFFPFPGCSQKLVIEMAVDLVLRPLLERLLEKHLKKHPEKLQLHQSRRDKLTIPETDKNDRFDLHALCRLLLEKPKNAGSGKKIGWLADAQKTIELCRDEIRYELAHGDRESCISPAVYTKLVEELTKREKELEEIIKKL